jgi:hypothetical protein
MVLLENQHAKQVQQAELPRQCHCVPLAASGTALLNGGDNNAYL